MKTALLIALSAWPVAALDGAVDVTGVVRIEYTKTSPAKPDNSNAVVSLEPLEKELPPPSAPKTFKILQRNKRFEPHLLAVPVGSHISFPNMDPFFHNVFSMFDGKRFDLGLYEAGGSHGVKFDRAGLSFIFCNIHPEMSAVVVVLATPYYAVSNRAGAFTITAVPEGRYMLRVWHERAMAEVPAREISISEDSVSLGSIRLIDSGQLVAPHKNKYGRDYDVSPGSSPVYK